MATIGIPDIALIILEHAEKNGWNRTVSELLSEVPQIADAYYLWKNSQNESYSHRLKPTLEGIYKDYYETISKINWLSEEEPYLYGTLKQIYGLANKIQALINLFLKQRKREVNSSEINMETEAENGNEVLRDFDPNEVFIEVKPEMPHFPGDSEEEKYDYPFNENEEKDHLNAEGQAVEESGNISDSVPHHQAASFLEKLLADNNATDSLPDQQLSNFIAANSSLENLEEDSNSKSQNPRKVARQSGEAYCSAKGKVIAARRFTHVLCNCRFQCNVLSEYQRKAVFDHFWSLKSWQKQSTFIYNSISVFKPKRSSVLNSRKQKSRVYSLYNKRVCKEVFIKTLDISAKRVDYILRRDTSLHICPPDKRGKGISTAIPNHKVDAINNFLGSLSEELRNNKSKRHIYKNFKENVSVDLHVSEPTFFKYLSMFVKSS